MADNSTLPDPSALPDPTNPMPDDSTIDDLLDHWEAANERGESPTIDELCHQHPHLKDQVARQIAALERLGQQFLNDKTSNPDRKAAELLSTSHLGGLVFHARGGLGVVYKGTEKGLNRTVAIKFIHHQMAENPECRSRFLLEAEVTGRLEHPGVVPVYGIGEADTGRLFYYMRFIDGDTLDTAISRYYSRVGSPQTRSEESVEFRRLLNSFISICKTIAYAHNRGIVHRDIKPANVILGRYGETVVVDWGLATPVSRDDRFRVSGEQTLMPSASGSQSSSSSNGGAGTLAYMSPEQASQLAPTPASDIYSLGATLYKILCGLPAFAGDNFHQIKQNVVDGRFPRPSKRGTPVARPLEAVCLKAMSLKPTDRYDTALDLATDIESYLADAPVSVLEETWHAKLSRWSRRHRSAVHVLFLGILALTLISALASIKLSQMARAEQSAHQAADLSRQQAEQARRENLRASARFLARSVAYEIDLRWRILEAEARSQELRNLLNNINDNPQDAASIDRLQAWLNERRLLKGEAVKNSAWCVYSANGTQVARAPRHKSLGELFRHRDYFHGFGRDFDLSDPRLPSIQPLQYAIDRAPNGETVHLSAVFESTNNARLMVTFSVPIWNEPPEVLARQVIGVLTLPLEINDFGLPQNAMLFQLRPDQFTDQPGMVIAHPQLGPRSEQDLPPRVSTQVIEQAEALRAQRRNPAVQLQTIDEILIDFTDPITGDETLAAIEPVLVASRPPSIGDTSWIVVVREQAPPPKVQPNPTQENSPAFQQSQPSHTR